MREGAERTYFSSFYLFRQDEGDASKLLSDVFDFVSEGRGRVSRSPPSGLNHTRASKLSEEVDGDEGEGPIGPVEEDGGEDVRLSGGCFLDPGYFAPGRR